MPIYDNLLAATRSFDPVMRRKPVDPFGGGLMTPGPTRPGGFIPPDMDMNMGPSTATPPMPLPTGGPGTPRGGFIPGQMPSPGRIFGPKPAPMVDPMGTEASMPPPMPTPRQGPIGRRREQQSLERQKRRANPGGWGGGITGQTF